MVSLAVVHKLIAAFGRDVPQSMFVHFIEFDPIADRWAEFPPILFAFETKQRGKSESPEDKDGVAVMAGGVHVELRIGRHAHRLAFHPTDQFIERRLLTKPTGADDASREAQIEIIAGGERSKVTESDLGMASQYAQAT